MTTAPQPPQPPGPPAPPRPRSHFLAITLLSLALIVAVSMLAVVAGLRYLSRTIEVQVDQGIGANRKGLSVKTPLGSLDVRKGADEARLGLPVYPGAKRVNDQESATVNIDIAGEENLRVLAAVFDTPDPLAKVRDFYHQRLGKEVTKFTENTDEGKTVFEIKRGEQEKSVSLKDENGKTRIELVRVVYGHGGAN